MNEPFSLTVAVGILVASVVASRMSAEAQTTIHGKTVNGKTMAGNTTGNMTKGNSTSMQTPEGPSPP